MLLRRLRLAGLQSAIDDFHQNIKIILKMPDSRSLKKLFWRKRRNVF